MERDDVHVSFNDDDLFFFPGLSRREGCRVQDVAFGKDPGIGRVQIFGFAAVHDAPAECDDFSAAVQNREHDAVAKIIVRGTPVRRKSQDSCRFYGVFGDFFLCQKGLKRVSAGGETQTETADRFVAQPSFAQVFQPLTPRR